MSQEATHYSCALNHHSVFLTRRQGRNPNLFNLPGSKFVKLADPITALVLLGVAVTVIVVDECYKAYQRHKLRKASDRELGITSADRREMRRLERERRREEREATREWQRRRRERRRLVDRLRRHGLDGVEVHEGEEDWDEMREGVGLPEYSPAPKDGDRSVVDGLTTAKKRGLKDLFKRKPQREPDVGVGRKRRWFKRREKRAESPPPPPYTLSD